MKAPTVVSLFSGCGGLDFGFAKAGAKIVFANDFNRFACETYRLNFKKFFNDDCEYLVEGDINKNFDQIPEGADLLIGGAPCQSWSIMGERRGFKDERGELSLKSIEILELKKPRFFIFENVAGMLSHDGGKSFQKILNRIDQAGYECIYRLLDFSEYGVPQRRKRVIIWGKQKGESLDLNRLIPSKSLNQASRLDSVLKALKPLLPNLPNHNFTISKVNQHLFAQILRPGENLSKISDTEVANRFKLLDIQWNPSELKRPQGHRPLWQLKPNEIAPTMVFNGGCNIPYHPWENRWFSVREAATIQTFPLQFEFCGSLKEQYKQVANAVPPTISTLLCQTLTSNFLSAV